MADPDAGTMTEYEAESAISDLDAWVAKSITGSLSPPPDADLDLGPDLDAWTAKELGAPSPRWCDKVKNMFLLLQDVFAPEVPVNQRQRYHLFPVGSFGRHMYCEGDKMDCLLIGDAREVRLRELLWQRLSDGAMKYGETHIFNVLPIELTPHWFILLVDNEVMFRIEYLQAKYDATLGLLASYQGSPPDRVAAYRRNLQEMIRLSVKIEANSTELVCYYFLRRWAERVGLYGELGHLSSYKLACLAPWVSERKLDSKLSDGVSNPLLRHRAFGSSQTQAGILLLKLCKLYTNVIETFPSPVSSSDFYGILETVAGGPFTSRFNSRAYIKISVNYTGRLRTQGTEMIRHIEEWMPHLFNKLENTYPKAEFRLWPNRLVKEGWNDDLSNSEWEGCWLIAMPDFYVPDAPVIRIVRGWIDMVKENAKESYSQSIMSLFAFMAPKSYIETQSLVNDLRKWPRPALAALPEDTPTAREAPALRKVELPPPQASSPGSHSFDKSLDSKSLRPALDVLHRLIHDPLFDLEDYVIGYADRHANANFEKPAASWVTEVTSDEFIPQCRIQYFKRVSDGVWVWDRKRRLDYIFI